MKQTEAHTPGPWHAFNSYGYINDDDENGGPDQVRDSKDVVIAWIPSAFWGRPANARLIAAAPDLLAACQRISDAPYGVAIGDLEFLRAAIEKATGK